MNIRIDLIEFMEGDTYIIYSPALDLTGYGYTPEEAFLSFKETLHEFIRYTHENKTFDQEMNRLGWQRIGKGGSVTIKTPDFSDLMKKNTHLEDIILHRPEYKRTTRDVEFA